MHDEAAIIQKIHGQYLEAGADLIETNTFNSTYISMADYKLEDQAYELNVAGAQNARAAAERSMAKDPGRCSIRGRSHGADQPTASMSPDVNDPAFRAVTTISWSTPIQTGARSGRRRGGRAAGGNGFRFVEFQGGVVCDRQDFREIGGGCR